MISRTKKLLLAAAAGALAITGLAVQPAHADPQPPPGYCVPDCGQDAYDLPNMGMPPLNVPPEGRKLTFGELARLNHSQGVPDNQLSTSVALGAAESGLFTNAHNGNGDDKSDGIYQCNFIGKLGPARLAKYHLDSPTDTYKPEVAVRIMMDQSGGGKNWKAWGAYLNGSYLKWKYEADRAASNVLNGTQFPDYTSPWGVQ